MLPVEVEEIAKNVSVEKKNEVQTVLNQVFDGVSKMREQLDTVNVVDPEDKVNMKLANTIRLGVRQVRLNAEKTFDKKREEVQQQMLSYKTEDQLWLKAKQTMQILTKEIEDQARWKEETKQRYEAEQRELKVQQRIVQVSKFSPEMSRSEFEHMSDDGFSLFLSGIEKQYNDRIEAEQKAEEERIENERVEKLRWLRSDEIRPYYNFFNDNGSVKLGLISEKEYQELLSKLKKAKSDYDAEQEKVRIENERLKKEAEAKEKALEIERQKVADERKASEEKAKKEREEAERILLEERKSAQEKLRVEQENARKLALEIESKNKAEQEAKEKAEREAKEKDYSEKLRIESELKKGDSDKVKDLINDLELLKSKYNFKSLENKKMYSDVGKLLDKVISHINQH